VDGIVERLLTVISDIYALPGNVDAWPDVLGELSNLSGSSSASFRSDDGKNVPLALSAAWGGTDDDFAYYEDQLAIHDLRLRNLNNLVPGKVFREFEFISDEENFDDNKWAQYRLRSRGEYYCLGARVSPHSLWNDVIFFNRQCSSGQHSNDEKKAIQDVLPHLSRAQELHRTFTDLRNRYGAVLTILDKLLVGVVILNDQGRVVIANKNAYRACENSRNLKLSADGWLRARDEDMDRLLREFIDKTGATANGMGNSPGGQISFAHRKNRFPLLLEVMPIRDDRLPDGNNIRGSMVFIIDPSQSQVLDVDGIARIFGLTGAETQITASIINGMTVDQVAEERGTSPETVRGQLKTVFSKTGAKGQSDLVRLAVKAAPPIERDRH
jgi:DNA-binding CsgD family transcriptional regulator